MKKLLIVLAAVLVVGLGAGGYFVFTGKSSTTRSSGTASNNTSARAAEPTLASVADKLTEAGITLGEKTVPYYQLVEAKDGVKYGVGDTDMIELYAYANKDKLNAGREQLDNGAGNVFTDGNVLILANSTDKEFVAKVKAAIEGH